MTTAEKNAKIKEYAVQSLNIPADAVQVGDFEYAIPVTVEGETRFAVMKLTAANNKDTKTAAAFNPDEKRREYLADKGEKEKNAQEKAAAAAKKESEKAAKKKEKAGE